MSSTVTGITEGRQPREGQGRVGMDYVPTEEERKVFRECNQESFWYRSVPFSVVSMAITQALVARVVEGWSCGYSFPDLYLHLPSAAADTVAVQTSYDTGAPGTLSASPRFGSLPKVAFAGFCGYLAGKMSYMKTCQEKFKHLENSPLGEALRQRTGLPPRYDTGAQSDTQSFESVFQSAESTDQRSYITESPLQMGRSEDLNTPAEPYIEDEEPKRKGILYEDLRLKNRENYEVLLTQKAESLLKSPEKEPKRHNKEVKNIYGDTWEE